MLRANSIVFLLCSLFGYEILNIPFSATDLSLSGGGRSIARDGLYTSEHSSIDSVRDNLYGYTFVRYPAAINHSSLYTIRESRSFHLSFLDYGRLHDGVTDDIFGAFDLLVETGDSGIAFDWFKVGYRFGIAYSKIAGYHSSAIYGSLSARTRLADDRIGISGSINNISFLIAESDSYSSSIPVISTLSFYLRPDYFAGLVSCDLNYNSYSEKFIGIISSQINISDRVAIITSLRSNKQDFHVGDASLDFFAGIGLGMEYKFRSYTISVGLRNQGANGVVSGITIRTQ